jgi:hypothetical protein
LNEDPTTIVPRASSEGNALIHEDGTVVARDFVFSNSINASANDNVSTRGVVSSPSADDVSSTGNSPNVAVGISIAAIRILDSIMDSYQGYGKAFKVGAAVAAAAQHYSSVNL